MTDPAESYMRQLIEAPTEQRNTVEEFKKALASLPQKFARDENKDNPPSLVIIVDELDRCKPLFALSILERIKHFMSVENVHFVLGVHQEQLESSIAYAYGSGIDAGLYLQKFINVTVRNPEQINGNNSRAMEKYAEHLQKSLSITVPQDSILSACSDTIVRSLEARGYGLRTLERAYTTLVLCLSFTTNMNARLGLLIGGIIVLKTCEPALYRKAKLGTLTLNEIQTALDLHTLDAGDRMGNWAAELWTYCLIGTMTPEIEKYANPPYGMGFEDRNEIVPYIANEVVERLAQ